VNRLFRPARRAVPLFLLLALAAACTTIGSRNLFAAAGAAEPLAGEPATFARPKRGDAVEALIVREADGWLLPAAIPAAAHLEQNDTMSLVVTGSPPGRQAVQLLERLRPRRVLAFTSVGDPLLAQGIESLRGHTVECGEDPTGAALRLARRVWRASTTVVVAGTDDAEGALMGSLLASHLAAPFIPVEPKEARRQIARVVRTLAARDVLAVGGRLERLAAWKGLDALPVRRLDTAAVQSEIVRRLGPAKIRNVILARAPTEGGESAWMAPLLSVARGAPVVLIDRADGLEAEAAVAAFVKRHKLAPQTITILGDYTSIGTIKIADPKRLGEYEVEIEPCSGSGRLGAASYGVGRLPLSSVRETSLLIAATLARDRVLAKKRFRALLIANPSTDYGPLPLCETVSRVTGEEFRNCRVALSDFYGKRADDKDVIDAAKTANLIVFEGHISDQYLFYTPLDDEPEPFPEPGPVFQNNGGLVLPPPALDPAEPPALAPEDPPVPGDPDPDEVPAREGTITDPPQPEPELPNLDPHEENPPFDAPDDIPPGEGDAPPGDILPGEEAPHPDDVPPAAPPVPQPPLDGMPLVVLQSCHSLEEGTARTVFERGGAGLVGSVTNIHSASGSSFIKQFCDRALYRGDTAGEALRDSRNYFLCLAKLKAERGHQQQPKVTRVALSFRLWGDPEMRIVHRDLARPRRAPVIVAWNGPDRLTVTVPKRRLPTSQTEKYRARMFPGSQAAGIVKSAKGRTQRRLMPLYFARLDLPAGFEKRGFRRVGSPDTKGPRSVFLVDEGRRYLFVVHFPEKEKAGESIVLPFAR
jgi:hypothetical protein